MSMSPLFSPGACEVSAGAARVLAAAGIDPALFFTRHASGDWGEAPNWLRTDNDRAARLERHSHALCSHFTLDGQKELRIVTAPARSRSLLLLAEEYETREVSVRDGYALWAASYENPNPLIAVEEPVVERILAALPRVGAAIDVGTGTGRLARKLARDRAASVLGVDTTPEMLAVARTLAEQEGLHNLQFTQTELGREPLPAASDTFDLLTCGLMLCHLPDLRASVRECVRVVRPGGWLLASDFHPATQRFGWRTDFITPEARLLLPNTPNTRRGYLDAFTEAGCVIAEAHDIALDGAPYGDVSDTAIAAKNLPPLCLVVLARKEPAAP